MMEGVPRYFVEVVFPDDGPDRGRRLFYNRFELVHPVLVMNQEMRRWTRKHELRSEKILKFLNEDGAYEDS